MLIIGWKLFITIVYLLVAMSIFSYIERKMINFFIYDHGFRKIKLSGFIKYGMDLLKVFSKEDKNLFSGRNSFYGLLILLHFCIAVSVFIFIPLPGGKIIFSHPVGFLLVFVFSFIRDLIGLGVIQRQEVALERILFLAFKNLALFLMIMSVYVALGTFDLDRIAKMQFPFFTFLYQPVVGLVFIYFLIQQAGMKGNFLQLEEESYFVESYFQKGARNGTYLGLFLFSEKIMFMAWISVFSIAFLGGYDFLPVKLILVFSGLVFIKKKIITSDIGQKIYFQWKFILPLLIVNILVSGLSLLWGQF